MKIVLIGDSIRMGYQELVTKICEGMEVWAPQPNCCHGVRVLDHFQEWITDQKPDVVPERAKNEISSSLQTV